MSVQQSLGCTQEGTAFPFISSILTAQTLICARTHGGTLTQTLTHVHTYTHALLGERSGGSDGQGLCISEPARGHTQGLDS